MPQQVAFEAGAAQQQAGLPARAVDAGGRRGGFDRHPRGRERRDGGRVRRGALGAGEAGAAGAEGAAQV